MRKRVVAAAAVVVAMAFAAPARAQSTDAAINADLQCAIVGLSLAGGDTVEMQQAGSMLALYYLGRLHAGAPNFSVEDAIVAQANTITMADIDGYRVRCGNEFAEVGRALTQMGARLQAQGGGADSK